MSETLWLGVAGAVLGLILGYLIRLLLAQQFRTSTEGKIRIEIETAKEKAKEIVMTAKDQAASILVEAQKEERERKNELRRLEDRLLKKEDYLEREKGVLEEERSNLKQELEKTETLIKEIQIKKEKTVEELERVADLTQEAARDRLLKEIENKHREELAETLIKLEKERKEQIEAKSLEIITSAIQRYARENISDITTTLIELPNEEIKGKIIGREGRNIRTFERLTGVEIIIDETPESLLLSSFDPYRRELAKLALEKLIKDGRIQPAKIEEKLEEAKLELEDHTRQLGEEAAYEIGVFDLPKEILYLLGKLNYRTSYGQNVLNHSIEMAHIAGMMAAELNLKVMVAKKAALLHDIGKAIDYEVEGAHTELGRKLLKKFEIDEEVIKAMEAHHEEYPFSTPESYIVTAADIISAARPGARRDALEKYLHRLEEVEKIAKEFEGVKQVFAVSAGREVRVFVVPEKIDDFGAIQLAKQIAGKIQSNLQYPGEIKVTVIREVRAIEYAR